jgi:APA family basic amino acid/polyamine antiporter
VIWDGWRVIEPVPAVSNSTASGAVRLSAMLGLAVFAGLAPATSAAGAWALAGVPLAGVLALCVGRAGSGRARGGPAGRIAGGLALAGYLLAAAAVAGAFGAYAMPQRPLLGTLGVLLLVAAALVAGMRLPSVVTVAGLVFLLMALAVVVVVCLAIEPVESYLPLISGLPGEDDPSGIVVAAGVLAVGLLSGHTGSPGRTGVLLVLVATGAVAAVLAAAAWQLGGPRLAVSPAPLRSALAAADASALEPLVTVAAGIGAGSALWLLLGAVRVKVVTMTRVPPEGVRAAVPPVVGCLLAGGVAVLLPPGPALAMAGCLLLLGSAIGLAARAMPAGPDRVPSVLGFGLCLLTGVALAVTQPVALIVAGVAAIVGTATWRLAPG